MEQDRVTALAGRPAHPDYAKGFDVPASGQHAADNLPNLSMMQTVSLSVPMFMTVKECVKLFRRSSPKCRLVRWINYWIDRFMSIVFERVIMKLRRKRRVVVVKRFAFELEVTSGAGRSSAAGPLFGKQRLEMDVLNQRGKCRVPQAFEAVARNFQPAHVASMNPGVTTWSRRSHPCAADKAANSVKLSSDRPEPHRYRNPVPAPAGVISPRSPLHGHFLLARAISLARALQREVKARVQEFRNESWSDLMEEITPSHKAFWKITKALKTEGYTPIPPLKRPDGSIALDDAEVAECIADSIETQCSHASPPHDTAHISHIEEEVLQKTSLEPKDDLTPVSLSEVQLLVRSLKTRKAPGLDGVSNKAIKCFPHQLLSLLVAIFNACLQNCYFPPAWKEAEVIGIHKPGKPRDLPASYRPISLLSGLAKLFERVLKTRLSKHLFGKGLIIDEQFGFRPAHSCPQQVLRLVEYVTEGFKTKQKTVAVFFDVAKAFDRVWHAGLVYKLYSLQVPDRLIFIIQNFLSNRTVLTYASPVFAHAAPEALYRLQVIQNKFCRAATDAHWTKRFFDIAGSHPNALLRAAVDYQPPPPTHFIRRPRNVLFDPPDALTAAVDSINDVNDTHD
ncbi:Probable RNA-directed DNA polymerase from transposon BS [Eumeta japonica]|uniref:Probable RNA-directed DNA polymerase from transposon BS n=1 Tax=Eumeta variegata TaxID=151549 RepID=A0A4C1TXF6_EUMVA|nr:Probable RNA-directed DNA polymerase from transposon BS [Eumeta japonica]